MDHQEIKEFFFNAMNCGSWATPAPRMPILELPGSKGISYPPLAGDIRQFKLLDYYFVKPGSDSSYGTTVIWFDDRPIWIMHYGGWYKKSVIPFLKRALRHNYMNYIFLGGRGPKRLEGEDHTLQYINDVELNDFCNFKGHEKIISTSPQLGVPVGQKLGEHYYFGGLL